MNLDGMIGEACKKRDGETNIDASNNVDVDHTTKNAAIVCGGIILKEQLWNCRHGNGFNRAIAGFTVAWRGPSMVLKESVNVRFTGHLNIVARLDAVDTIEQLKDPFVLKINLVFSADNRE